MRLIKGSIGVLFILVLTQLVAAQTLQIGLVNQDPDPVTAGDVVEVKFKIENLWETTKYPVEVEILPEYPFEVYAGPASKNIGVVTGTQFGGDAEIVGFKLKVDGKAVEGDHEIKLKIKVGETEWTYKETFFIDIKSEQLRFRAYISSSDITTPGAKGRFSVEFANAGGYDIDYLEMELLPSQDYKLLSTSSYTYIGQLQSDDTESEEFQIYVPENVEIVHIPIKVNYEVNDQVYEEEQNLQLELLTKEEAKKIGLIKESYAPYIWGGIILGIIFFFILRRFKKR